MLLCARSKHWINIENRVAGHDGKSNHSPVIVIEQVGLMGCNWHPFWLEDNYFIRRNCRRTKLEKSQYLSYASKVFVAIVESMIHEVRMSSISIVDMYLIKDTSRRSKLFPIGRQYSVLPFQLGLARLVIVAYFRFYYLRPGLSFESNCEE